MQKQRWLFIMILGVVAIKALRFVGAKGKNRTYALLSYWDSYGGEVRFLGHAPAGRWITPGRYKHQGNADTRKWFQALHNRRESQMFSVSEYLSRIERAHLDILEGLKPVSKAITLWLGLDGLRLNEDGTMEWVSRKKHAENAVYQPCQFGQPIRAGLQQAGWTGQTQMAQNAVLQMQSLQNMQIANTLQLCCVQYPAQYPPYYYGGCCDRNIEGVILDRFY